LLEIEFVGEFYIEVIVEPQFINRNEFSVDPSSPILGYLVIFLTKVKASESFIQGRIAADLAP
jgi:hypothetical protein